MRVLAHMDGMMDQEEKKKIDEIRSLVLSKIDLPSVEKEIVALEKAHQNDSFKVYNKASYLESLHKKILKTIK
jgi:hypothetical protein